MKILNTRAKQEKNKTELKCVKNASAVKVVVVFVVVVVVMAMPSKKLVTPCANNDAQYSFVLAPQCHLCHLQHVNGADGSQTFFFETFHHKGYAMIEFV